MVQYITSIPPSYENRSHKECKPEICLHIPQSEDYAQHLPECVAGASSCQLVEFELELINNLASKRIPGVRRVSRDGQIDNYHIANVKGEDFVAISHVWAHGLGSPN